MEDNIPFQQYMYIQMLRPDLVPLPFLKEKAFDNVGMDKLYNQYTRGELNDAVLGNGDLGRNLYNNNIDLGYKSDQERDTYLNYNAKRAEKSYC